MPTELKFTHAIPCDDIRMETSGKAILIGVYATNILISSFPALLSITFWLQYIADAPGVASITGRLMGPGNRQLAGFQMEGQIHQAGPSAFAVPQLPLNIEEAGDLQLQMKQDKGRWKTVMTIPVLPKT